MKLIVYFVSFITAAIGYYVGREIQDAVDVDIGGLTTAQINGLINGLVWFLVCLIVFFVAKKLEEKWFGLVTLDFLLTWAFVCAGIILGLLIYILVDTGELSVEFDQIKDAFFSNLAITLGPTASVALGLRE